MNLPKLLYVKEFFFFNTKDYYSIRYTLGGFDIFELNPVDENYFELISIDGSEYKSNLIPIQFFLNSGFSFNATEYFDEANFIRLKNYLLTLKTTE